MDSNKLIALGWQPGVGLVRGLSLAYADMTNHALG
jgi:hypothetical protein